MQEFAAEKPIRTRENKKSTTWKKDTEEEESEPEETQQITQIKRVLSDENDNYGIKLKTNGKYQNFTIDTGSPVTKMPNNPELYNQREIKPLKERYQDVNKNEIQFLGKIWADIEYNGKTTKLPILITKRNDITPLLGVNWLKQLPITINKIQLDEPTNQSETIYAKFNKLFETNHTTKNIEVKIPIKPGCYPIQQKARPIPFHLQKDVKNELDRLIKSGHLERLETIEEDCFVSPVVITVKKDKTVKIALDARKLNDSCVKKRPHMPNMKELLNQISAELSKNDRDPIWISVVDLDYAYGQMKLVPETSKHCNFAMTGEKINGHYQFLKGFYSPADIPTIFQEKLDRTLGHQTPVWLDDVIIVTRGTKEEHTRKLYSVLTKLETETNQSETIYAKFNKLFETNHTTKNIEVKIQIKPGCYPIQQKARPIPFHLQKDVKNELDRLIKSGHLERLETIEEDCFVSPVVITVKKDKTVKIALDARKLNDSCVKKRPHMPNMKELLNQISAELSKNDRDPIWISVVDLDYAYGQMKLVPETSKHCNFAMTGEKINGHYQFLKGFYSPADIPTIFQEKLDRTLGHQTPVWLDDVIIVTRGTKEEHTRKLYSVLTKLENEGYKASKKTSKFYQKETIWLGHTISQDGIRPNKEKTDAINKLEPPTNAKALKSFLGAIQYFAKFIPTLSEKTDNMRQLLKKGTKWEWTTDRYSDFNKIKQELTSLPCLAHYNGNKENIVTTDACKTGLGIALWQKQGSPV